MYYQTRHTTRPVNVGGLPWRGRTAWAWGGGPGCTTGWSGSGRHAPTRNTTWGNQHTVLLYISPAADDVYAAAVVFVVVVVGLLLLLLLLLVLLLLLLVVVKRLIYFVQCMSIQEKQSFFRVVSTPRVSYLPVAKIVPLAEPRQERTTKTGMTQAITPNMCSPQPCTQIIII